MSFLAKVQKRYAVAAKDDSDEYQIIDDPWRPGKFYLRDKNGEASHQGSSKEKLNQIIEKMKNIPRASAELEKAHQEFIKSPEVKGIRSVDFYFYLSKDKDEYVYTDSSNDTRFGETKVYEALKKIAAKNKLKTDLYKSEKGYSEYSMRVASKDKVGEM